MMTATTAASAVAAQTWDDAAAGWHQHASMLDEWLQESTAIMLAAAGIGAGSKVLDIAAGSGGQTLAIARKVGAEGEVLATDVSPRSLALGQARLRAAGFDRVHAKIADAQALGLDGAGFDAAVSRLGLMFCRAPLEALGSARAALKPGGRLAAIVFSQPSQNPCIAIMMATAMRHAGLNPAPPFAPGSLLSLGKPGLMAELLADAGFVEVRIEAIAAPMHLPSCQHYIQFVRTAGLPIMALLAALSAPAQADAWRDIEEQLARFETSAGWGGPNELLLCAGRAT